MALWLIRSTINELRNLRSARSVVRVSTKDLTGFGVDPSKFYNLLALMSEAPRTAECGPRRIFVMALSAELASGAIFMPDVAMRTVALVSLFKSGSSYRSHGHCPALRMRFRPPLANHPRLGALATVILGLFIFGAVFPWLTHEPPHWPVAIATSVWFGIVNYLLRTGTARTMVYLLVGVGIIGLLVYGRTTFVNGIPEGRSERFWWTFVVAIPVAALVLAWRLYRRSPARQ